MSPVDEIMRLASLMATARVRRCMTNQVHARGVSASAAERLKAEQRVEAAELALRTAVEALITPKDSP